MASHFHPSARDTVPRHPPRVALACVAICSASAFAVGCTPSLQPAVEADSPEVSTSAASTGSSANASITTASPLIRPTQSLSGSPKNSQRPEGRAMTMLASLPVKGRAPRSGYARNEFGQGWGDLDRDECDTRNEILRRDLKDAQLKTGSDCIVASGLLDDPYSGSSIQFVRGTDTSSEVQIDHVVSLGDAWQTGAQQLSPQARELLANDPLNLLAVQGRVNTSKGDSDAASWLPPNKSFRCDYVSRQIAVKARYGLWVTPAERDAMQSTLAKCSDERISSP